MLWAMYLLPHLASAQRTEVSFSYAWRFHYGPGGDDAGAGPGNAWAAAFSDIITNCTDGYPDPHRMTSTDCATSCAYDPSCFAWIHVPGVARCAHHPSTTTCSHAASNATANGARRAAATPLQTAYAWGAASLPEADAWDLVDAPHDGLASLRGSFSEAGGDSRHGYRVRTVLWYRKNFSLPAAWGADGGPTFLRFDGIMHFAQVWVNGAYVGAHSSTYTPWAVRLDNVSGIAFGAGAANVVAVRADASYGSEHWYGGGGLIRPVHLVHVGPQAFVESGVWVPPELPAGSTTVAASAEWENAAAAPATGAVLLEVRDPAGAVVASAQSAAAPAPGGGAATARSTASLARPASVALWAPAAPAHYTLTATLLVGGAPVDVVNATVGFRRTRWDPATGFAINGVGIKQRGFSHHNSFAGVGVAMPQRLDLFRAQVSRALGGNIWRMSHNPYRSGLYDVLDLLGVLAWDENRDMGPSYVWEMHDMVKRGRNHPSIIVNSLCNEIECDNLPSVGLAMVNYSKALDPTRPTTANSDSDDGLGAIIDIQGFSHKAPPAFVAAHQANPNQPLVLCVRARFFFCAQGASC